ncbi:TPA: hypothetical protein MO340_004196 [Salmonella enterica subsp. salamae serovar 35:g,m,s,t:-]|nr:hypothetical protein [Salmonella enterica subsp. salamae serovar 35:g,m,s,t:-]HCA3549668.1 hypothetical protein [Salmonella enterica subsp. salamae serovar 35:g,m,s,t:-]
MKNKFGFMDNGTLLTIVDSNHQALFSIQNPTALNACFHRSGNSILMFSSDTILRSSENTRALYEAQSTDEAQQILDTLLRGLVKMTLFKRMTIGAFIWLAALMVMLIFKQSDAKEVAVCILMFVPVFALSIFGLTHFEKTIRLLSVYARNPAEQNKITSESEEKQ